MTNINTFKISIAVCGALAVAPVSMAAPKDNAAQIIEEVDKAIEAYDFDKVPLLFQRFGRLPQPQRTADAEARMQQALHQARIGSEMLQGVEDIVVVDSITVSAADFFRHYPLSPAAGTLTADDHDGPVANSPAYTTQNGILRFFTVADGPDATAIATCRVLADGTTESPRTLRRHEGIAAAAYPFLMPDGLTLYFAAKGDQSLGGYDIFITRRSGIDDEFLTPQNVGMPYNSPADDYLLAIDEATGCGWWATDRAHIPGKVTIYFFVPAEVRRNLSPDTPGLAERARLTSIKDTWPDGLKPRLGATLSQTSMRAADDEIAFALPGGRVLTHLTDIPAGATRDMLEEWAEGMKDLQFDRARLANLRLEYAKGKKQHAAEILQLEQALPRQRTALQHLANKIIATLYSR